MDETELLRELGQQLRVDAVRMTAAAGSGHPTSSMSAADLAAVLLARHLRYDFERPRDPRNDRLIFSKGHASPLLYALLRAAGAIGEDELMTYRRISSRLEGHPRPVLPLVDVATGSLGQGLPIGVGMAYAGKHLDRLPMRVWALCGDGEMAEGSMWEAVEHAAHYGLDNLVAIVDVNRLGQSGETMHGRSLDAYSTRLRAFGWHAIEIDGHDIGEIDRAYAEAESNGDRPTAIVARTVKGKGYSAVEDEPGWHGKPLADPEAAIRELGGVRHLGVEVRTPPPARGHRFRPASRERPRYETGSEVATRRAYGEALAALGAERADIVVLDGEVSNSTHAGVFREAHPERFVEAYIAEQQVIGAAVGMQALGWTPFASSFAAFLSRASDFVRMAAIGEASLRICGSHAGVSIGEDGPSQMGLEDLATFRALHGSTVLYPCDGNQTEKLVRLMADLDGISYLRTTRASTPVVYEPDAGFEVGGSVTLLSSPDDEVAILAAGITVHEALAAAEALGREQIPARVIDCYSVEPVDRATVRALDLPIVTVEDHRPEGGLGDAVLAALADADGRPPVVKLAVRDLPHSGRPSELLAAAGIDAAAIAAAARRLAREHAAA